MFKPTGAVFLSYASEDAAAASCVCTSLRAAGIEVWFDQSELRGGDAWYAAIREQIKGRALFIPVISRNPHARDEVLSPRVELHLLTPAQNRASSPKSRGFTPSLTAAEAGFL